MTKTATRSRKTSINTDANLNLRQRAASFTDKQVDGMLVKLGESVARRDAASDNGGASWIASRKLIEANRISVSRFFLAMNLEPSNVIENRLVSSALFNAKALKKVVEIARFVVTGQRDKFEKVMSSFIVCALAFSQKNDGAAISNRVNKSFLSNLDFTNIVADQELADYLADYQHKYITGGKDTQSSQARRVLEVLGLGTIENCENRSRGGIAINETHDFFAVFCEDFVK